MDMFTFILKIIIFLPFIILLIYLSLKVGGKKLQNIQNGSHMKVIERVQVSKENTLLLVKIGDRGYIMSSSPQGITTLEEISKDELNEIQEKKAREAKENTEEIKKLLNKISIKGRLTR